MQSFILLNLQIFFQQQRTTEIGDKPLPSIAKLGTIHFSTLPKAQYRVRGFDRSGRFMAQFTFGSRLGEKRRAFAATVANKRSP